MDAGGTVPPPSSLERLAHDPAYEGWALAVVSIDPATLDDTPEHIEITLPRRVLHRLDERAHAAGLSRAGLIAGLALCPTPAPGTFPRPP